MHHIILEILRIISRFIILRHHPIIIGVTGTVGKTTITTHVAQFLLRELGKGSVGYSSYHYNGEYGVPLTIIGARSPAKNPFLWIWVFLIGLWRIIAPYPRYLVLEYGIDHPGEMDFLLSIAHPDIAILTPVESNHLEQFITLENYRSHKIKLVTAA
jgi:UDP-N-acetylmuramoyl-tripeptide--D-alanyl-D-alanine ligase